VARFLALKVGMGEDDAEYSWVEGVDKEEAGENAECWDPIYNTVVLSETEVANLVSFLNVCSECGKPREGDERVESGMKCGPCNYGGG